MSTIKSYIHLASCRFLGRLSRKSLYRVRSSLSSLKSTKQYQRSFSSTRNTPKISTSPKPGLNILTALPALCLLGFTYKHLNPEFNHPLALDVPDPSEGVDSRAVQYRPTLRPPTAEEVSDILRWEESSRCLEPPTDVLRYDSVRIPSNQPCEDYLVTAFLSGARSNVMGKNSEWFISGLFDGHA